MTQRIQPTLNVAIDDGTYEEGPDEKNLQLEVLLKVSPPGRTTPASPTVYAEQNCVATTEGTEPISAPTTEATNTTNTTEKKRQFSELLDIVEYVRLLQKLRNSKGNRRNSGDVSGRSAQLMKKAQQRLRALLEATDASASALDGENFAEDQLITLETTGEAAPVNHSSSLRNASAEVEKRASSIGDTDSLLSYRDETTQPQDSGKDADRNIRLQMPEPLDDAKKRLKQPQSSQQPHPNRPLPQLPPQQAPGPKVILAFKPLATVRLTSPVLSLAFDTVGRRLISAESALGVRFRSVTISGDDLTAGDRLDWRVWAQAACVLPGGNLLVATPSNLQILRSDGTRLAVSERRCGITSLALHDRCALALDSWRGRIYVYKLPRLSIREHHPLNAVASVDRVTGGGGQAQVTLNCPVAICTLRHLVAIAQYSDTLLTLYVDTARLFQSITVSNLRGPKHLASCNRLGLLFMSLMANQCVHIFRLSGTSLFKVGSYSDPGIRPGPLAWLPVNGILFCACSLADDCRRHELLSLGLHEAERTNWTPRAIRLMPL